MSRRYWPAALAILALFLFGSYLVYTQHLVRQIRAQSLILTEMFADVQRGLVSLEEDAQLEALLELQKNVLALDVPLIATDADGRLTAADNLPFAGDLTTSAGRLRVQEYVAALRQRGRFVTTTNVGTVYYGD